MSRIESVRKDDSEYVNKENKRKPLASALWRAAMTLCINILNDWTSTNANTSKPKSWRGS